MAQPQQQNPSQEPPDAATAATIPHYPYALIPPIDHDPAGGDLIPKCYIAGGIFVPIAADLSEPFTTPATQVARLREAIARLDAHSAAVQSNLLNLVTRETARLAQDGRRHEASFAAHGPVPEVAPGLEPNDLDEMISNMSVFHKPGVDYNIATIPEPDFPSALTARSPREWTANETLRSLHKGVTDLDGYEKHVQRVRAGYEEALKEALESEAK
ncbi:hypothetical protein B0J13DRAFT_214608 [Dactylonectria estremocensis]|uniref:Uncharacterized protein n=1 Tax=Dactylonectria estremocensis TaxID=1079267 RepID=A0A9P9F731_9HYPO|nr:hypothetical protein B0J13DRAFT_214608 [Dactylonectria estremocensis]